MGPDKGHAGVARCIRGEIRKRDLDARRRCLRAAHRSATALRATRECAVHPMQTWSARRRMNVSQRAQLLKRHPFVGLVRLFDVSGAANDRRNVRVVEQATPRCRTTPCRSRACHCRPCRVRRSRCRRACRTRACAESWSNSIWVAGLTACMSGSNVAAKRLTSASRASGSSKGRCRNSKSKVQSRGTILSAVPPWITPVWTVV